VTDLDPGRLGQVLADAVPDLRPPPDRMAAIGRRVRRSQQAWSGLAAGVTTVAAAAALVAVPPDGPRTPAPQFAEETAAVCRPRLPFSSPRTWDPDPSSPLVQAGARSATLCTYRLADQRLQPGYRLEARSDLRGDPADLVAALNALPALPANNFCTDAGIPTYLVVLTYPDGRRVPVHLDDNCDAAARGDDMRRVRDADLARLLGYFRSAR
jgi:hypothetical protein